MNKELFGLEARRNAREEVAHPGKFEGQGPMTVILYMAVMDESWSDASYSNETNWMERVGKYLLCGDDHGFVWSVRCKDEAGAIDVFDNQSKLWDAVEDAELIA